MGNCIKSNTNNKVKHDPLEGYEFSLTQDGIKTSYHITTSNRNYIIAYVGNIIIEGREYNLSPYRLCGNVDFGIETVFIRTKKGFKFESYRLIRKTYNTFDYIPFYFKGDRYMINAAIKTRNENIKGQYDLAEEIYPKVVKTYKDHEFESDGLKLSINLN